MKIISHKNKLIKLIYNEKNLGFVPTMGGIHLGHISLIKRSIRECKKTIVSIFINKPQFNKKSDFIRYPRTLKKDILKLKKLKIHLLYLPSVKEIYPNGPNKSIKISSLEKKLCGKNRPGHFKAVVDVIDRFIKIIKPKKIFFGEKDMQQLKIIDHFTKKYHPTTKVIPCKTVREKNGLALSSRNYLLSANEKKIASRVFKIINRKKNKLIKRSTNLKKIKKLIYSFGVKKIDYIETLDINKMVRPYLKKKKYKIFIAYYLRSTRLIDNI